jgi:hypothetical protein
VDPGAAQNMVILTYLLTEMNPSSETANCAATQEISSILWNPKVHFILLDFIILIMFSEKYKL